MFKEIRDMTTEEFNNLDEEKKREIIVEADKVSEWRNEFTRFELFVFDDFYIETKTAINLNGRRTTTTYTNSNLPIKYASQVQKRLLEKYLY